MPKRIPIICEAKQGQTLRISVSAKTYDMSIRGWQYSVEVLPLGRTILTPADHSIQEHVGGSTHDPAEVVAIVVDRERDQRVTRRATDSGAAAVLTIRLADDVQVFGDATTLSIAHRQVGMQRCVNIYLNDDFAGKGLAESIGILSPPEELALNQRDGQLRAKAALRPWWRFWR
jgi:hypothetical protein